MKASEAEVLTVNALQGQNGEVKVAMDKIFGAIQNACAKGVREVSIGNLLSGLNGPQKKAVESRLIEDGYTVSTGCDQREGFWFWVSWGKR